MTHLRRILLTLLLTAAAHAGAIELRHEARVASGAPVTLADIAILEGADAEALAGVPIDVRLNPRGMREIDVATLRDQLNDHRVNWGRLALRGSSCVILDGAPREVARDKPDADAPYQRDALTVPALDGPETVRSRLVRAMARYYRVSIEDLRVGFDPRDAELLATPEFGRRIEIEPEAGARSRRAPVRVRTYVKDVIEHERTIRVDVEVRRSAWILLGEVSRGGAVTERRVREERRWMPPGESGATRDEIIGARATRQLAPGELIESSDVEPPIAVRRGELSTVRCVRGGVVLTARARAQADARVGDVIEFKLEGRRNTFLARVDGQGTAMALRAETDDARTEADS